MERKSLAKNKDIRLEFALNSDKIPVFFNRLAARVNKKIRHPPKKTKKKNKKKTTNI